MTASGQSVVTVSALLSGTSAPMAVNAQAQTSVAAGISTAIRLAASVICRAQASSQFTTAITMVAAAQGDANLGASLGAVPRFTTDGKSRLGRRRLAVIKQRIG
jgi:hypothetical protein